MIKIHKKLITKMGLKADGSVKILFRFFSDVLDEETLETLWATVLDKEKGLYKIDSIPFYTPSLALDDIVFAVYDNQEEILAFQTTVSYSGNSTIQIVLLDMTQDLNLIRKLFIELGCSSGRLNESYFSMNVPAAVDYKNVKQKMKELTTQGIIDYAEACLADGHRAL